MSLKEALQQSFLRGTLPRNLDGFYKGKLMFFIPGNAMEFVGGLIARIWLPWYGKEFDKNRKRGSNTLPSYMTSFIKSRYGNKAVVSEEQNSIHAFPFHTKVTQGLKDAIQVLQLDYDLPENPVQVRKVKDELVCIGKNEYLGKAYLREKNDFRLLAFFSLQKYNEGHEI